MYESGKETINMVLLDREKCDKIGSIIGHEKSKWTDSKFCLIDLSWSVLTGINLRKSNLVDGDLSRTNLTGADLSYSNMENANLRGVKLKGADLCHVKVDDTDLQQSINRYCDRLWGKKSKWERR